MENIDRIMDSIKSESIRPKPKWTFSVRNFLVWFAFVTAVAIGAASFSIILLVLKHTDFILTDHILHSRIEMFLGLLPFIWLALLTAGLILAVLILSKTWKGYKFSILNLLLINCLFSIAIGTFYFLGGGAQKLESAFSINIASYESLQERKVKIWSNPEVGMLSGLIEEVSDTTMRLQDFNNKIWDIHLSHAFIAPPVNLQPGEKIKIVGTKDGPNKFMASEIRPWGMERGRALRKEN